MKKSLHISYYKPQQTGVSMYDLDGEEDIVSKVTNIVQSKLRKGKKNVPIQPRIHAQAILNLSILSCETRSPGLTAVAFYLSLLLDKHSPSHVEILQATIARQIKLSVPSVIKALHTLDELRYVKSIGKSVYYISPRLAFYGSNIEWSLALQYEEEGKTYAEYKVKCAEVTAQIAKTQEAVLGNNTVQ